MQTAKRQFKVSSQAAKDFFRDSPLWALMVEVLEAQLAEQRRLCSTMEEEMAVRKSQGQCLVLDSILKGSVRDQVVKILIEAEKDQT